MLESLLLLLGRLFVFAGFIGKANMFPKPLSTEEEKKCLASSAEGNAEARAMLIEHNLRLVAHIARKYSSAAENDDLISIGTIGLIKAVTSYDAEKNIRFATYASKCIENEIRMSLRSDKKRRGDVYLDDPVGTDRDGNSITVGDTVGTDSDEVFETAASSVDRTHIGRLIGTCLTDRERRIMEMRYGLNGCRCRTQREIAADLGISRSYVSRIETAAIRKIKNGIGGY